MAADWVSVIQGAFTILLGGTLITGILKYVVDRRKVNSDSVVALRGAEREEGDSLNDRWEALFSAQNDRITRLEAQVTSVLGQNDALRADNIVKDQMISRKDRELNLAEIYIDTLVARLPPPPPTRPTVIG